MPVSVWVLDRLAAELELEPTFRLEPVAMAEEPRATLRAELGDRGLSLVKLHSGAGHDAVILTGGGVPTAMLFVRSLNAGHSPDEFSSAEDIGLAVDVLAGALGRRASRPD
jgi:acetylornithine deacetylase/succinyl-diaminopimelate desuccinylase-like protein